MDARPASWFQQAEWGRAGLAALAAAAVFAVAWTAVHYGFYADNHIVDTPVYQRYGDAIVGGNVPYRDFTIEYPPAALPVFTVPDSLAGRVAELVRPGLRPPDGDLRGGDGRARRVHTRP